MTSPIIQTKKQFNVGGKPVTESQYYEAMSRFETAVMPKMKFTAKIKGDTVEGELYDTEHHRPPTEYTTEEKPL